MFVAIKIYIVLQTRAMPHVHPTSENNEPKNYLDTKQ